MTIEKQDAAQLLALGADNKRAFAAGEVVLIGAGPGDPDLLTLRAWRLLQQAECLVYDRLVSDEILALAPAAAERLYVGKQCDQHALSQTEINALLVARAARGLKVVRLKGGDPFIFGRGGEEVQALLEAGIACRVVPGITAASGCCTYAGIPLTHRDLVHGCTFVTGHLQNDELALPWAALARTDHTLVIYMGIKTAPIWSRKLLGQGMPADLPVAIICEGTQTGQQCWRTSLARVTDTIARHQIQAPALVVVGKVVNALAQPALLPAAEVACA